MVGRSRRLKYPKLNMLHVTYRCLFKREAKLVQSSNGEHTKMAETKHTLR